MRYTHNFCAICYAELPRPQNTCGARECLDAWRHLGRDARIRRKNISSYTPSERALAEAQQPTPLESVPPEIAPEMVELLTTPPPTPTGEKFLRTLMDPANAPLTNPKKQED